jgi:hypothetical protein
MIDAGRSMSRTDGTSRWKTILGDSFGLIVVIWSIPLAILLVGLPVALLFMGARMAARMIWP